jgi:hypothetical protein
MMMLPINERRMPCTLEQYVSVSLIARLLNQWQKTDTEEKYINFEYLRGVCGVALLDRIGVILFKMQWATTHVLHVTDI